LRIVRSRIGLAIVAVAVSAALGLWAQAPAPAPAPAQAPASATAPAPVSYRLSFPQREHRLMDVEVVFADLPAAPLQVRMSRSSPGRYAMHDFAKNVFDVRITDAGGRALAFTRPNPHQWDVPVHESTVRVTYRVFGDRVDGTYLGIDSTHAHINMPAALMWARGLELRPAQVRFEQPAGAAWRVATQLLPGPDPLTFTAPNLQYLMDSPSEFSAFALKTFAITGGVSVPVFRVAVHHRGDEALLDGFAGQVESIVRAARNVFGEFAPFDGGTYTFIADYVPWASGDGMEHRNSTILTSSSSIRTDKADLLDTIAHEFFHSWNVERIRPKGLEPFNLEDVNLSGELWLAEGFTSYYAPLLTRRAGVSGLSDFVTEMSRAVDAVVTGPGRQVRTAEQMSQHAPFVDAATSIDRTNVDTTFISYYTWGEAIALGLDLSLRDRTDGRVTLDDFMRRLWTDFGKPGGARPGYVDRPYTIDDARETLAAVSGDAAFARDYFARYIQGHEVPDYARLLARAGFVLRPVARGAGWAGDFRMQGTAGGVRINSGVALSSPAFAAGLDRDDVIVSLDGQAVGSDADVRRLTAARRPGDQMRVVFERRGERVTATMRLAEDPHQQIVTVEQGGGTPTEAQRRFRDAWLGAAAP
jgi:predicted metalloprotease with PDZ domain